MNAVVKGSLGLGVAVGLISIAFVAAGLHTNPMMGLVSIGLFIVLNVGAVFWVLSQTAAENTYGQQLLNGLLVGVLAGVVIFILSWLNLTVFFPDAIEEIRVGTLEWMEASGVPEAQIETQAAKLEDSTAVSQALSGLIGTLLTSVIIAAVVAIFKRKQ